MAMNEGDQKENESSMTRKSARQRPQRQGLVVDSGNVKKTPAKSVNKVPTAEKRQRVKAKPAKRFVDSQPTVFNCDWTPVGEGAYKSVVLALDKPRAERLCYDAIRHNAHDVTVRVRDCVKVFSEDEFEYIGKIMSLFYDEKAETLKASLIWYYTPDQLDTRALKTREELLGAKRSFAFHDRELLASRHVETVGVDTIEAKVHVLTFNEYCRYKSLQAWTKRCGIQSDEGFVHSPLNSRLPALDTDDEFVYFCRAVYNLNVKRIRVPQKPRLPFKALSKNRSIKSR
ncbi:bromo adjacent domain-containing 1 protein isoform 2 [Aphelenchoides avenae]|nr:bromo adjacent domain-containing 1 protein isoform 2 [Aphelenchus avenae]